MSRSQQVSSHGRHAADSHDWIIVRGARENNLKSIDVRLPKRRLTVFAGISGSGKSSLVFGTIAAESRRLINETYSAFVQGFMPSIPRPDVDVLEGLTTAIIVDQERMGTNARSTVGTATDARSFGARHFEAPLRCEPRLSQARAAPHRALRRRAAAAEARRPHG